MKKKAAPPGARRWLAEEMMGWVSWVKQREHASLTPHPSLVGYLVGSAELTDEERQQLDEALGYHKPEPL